MPQEGLQPENILYAELLPLGHSLTQNEQFVEKRNFKIRGKNGPSLVGNNAKLDGLGRSKGTSRKVWDTQFGAVENCT